MVYFQNQVLKFRRRQASCSRGWLRILVQYTFGAITVASFIMIVMISMRSDTKEHRKNEVSSCSLQNCRIICNDTVPSLYEDVLSIVSESEVLCTRLALTFVNPYFEHETMPAQWLSNLRSSIYRLNIIRGNLRFIAPQAFMSLFAGNIEILVFEGITISNWAADMLVGLSSLQRLDIKLCNIMNVQRNSLRAVDETLKVIMFTYNGNWNPVNISGSTEMSALETVDFSFNIFNSILSNTSFTGLRNCKILYLNSCNITALGPGAFDSLDSIEVIYLNNNLLVTVPVGLFDGLINRVNPKPRINLQDNPWYCDCSSYDLRRLYYNDLLYLIPLCDTPEELHGKPFSAISNNCEKTNCSYADIVVVDLVEVPQGKSVIHTYTSVCSSEITSNTSMYPKEMYGCEGNIITIAMLNQLSRTVNERISESDWITPTYLARSNQHSIVQFSTLSTEDYGILWYKSSCPNEIHCMASLPRFLRIYDLYIGSEYIFCPIDLKHGYIRGDKCVNYNTMHLESKSTINVFFSVILYISTIMICIAVGAVIVYGIIRYNPVLLKGSKRLLFVKHKNVDALVLPPKVPLRNTLSNTDPNFNFTKINVLSENENSLSPRNFVRMKSTRSDVSTVSYISALQPTDDQLAEWRVKRHIDNNFTITSDSEVSIFSWANDGSSSSEYYSSIGYDSLK
ncbi:uncharacterized protein LOC106137908 isoform X2 [Amyelois transitella]|uniref:uncharacterized protein LOC106137908 isoform X2 n=1 Tax=Amyelois transitella TaxID=680683 RepID=UPI00298FC256|nr:uncharacterized protein LOC106137908 isoform X2 [Amyelois transitella]